MRTERLYYNEPDLLEFEAEVIDSLQFGERIGVVLDRTAFYPTSGGQPHDLGTLGGVALLDCYEDEKSGDIIHILATKPAATRVRGQVDADRRKDHMQQHSGQHVLSRAFVELYNWPTVSFHLGAATCTIDLAVESATRDQQARKRIEDLESKLLDHEAEVFPIDEGYAIAAFRNRGMEAIKHLAARIAKRPGAVILIVDQSDQLRVVFARSADSKVDVAALLKRTIEEFGGRGGGRPDFAQAGGLNASSPEEVLGFAKRILSE